jgi:CRP-like cAMP-binding protein
VSIVQNLPVPNYLLAALPRNDFDRLLTQCEEVELFFSEVLYYSGEFIPHIYFPIGSFISLVTSVDQNANLEMGLVGNEGMLGVTTILGVEIAPFQALVQGAGLALRIPVQSFLLELKQSAALQQALNHYLYVLMRQLAQTAACNRYHIVEARLARWLLMTQDRANSDQLNITHVFLAYMLGVRRVGITQAANSLLKKNLISYKRGVITMLDRVGLESVSCSCYLADKEIYKHILG